MQVGFVFIELCIRFQYPEYIRVGVEAKCNATFTSTQGYRHSSISDVRSDVDSQISFFDKLFKNPPLVYSGDKEARAQDCPN